MNTNRFILSLYLALCAHVSVHAADNRILWQIGRSDGSDSEFALAPGGYAKFSRDAGYVVGFSGAAQDWLYVQPGPVDAWAGCRSHTFAIAFGLQRTVAGGPVEMNLDLVDAHSYAPPRIRVELSGQHIERQLQAGAGDASVFGDPGKGRPQKLTFRLPASALKAGDNEISTTTLSGNWLPYDALSLEAPSAAKLKLEVSVTRLASAKTLIW